MDKIFAKTIKNLILGTFKPSKPSPSELIFKYWDLSLFLLYDVKILEKKQKKLMIQRSSITDKWEKEQNQINKTLLLKWVSN